ncbi:MAG: amidohydrolase family protein [Anaerolineae bacterium]|nr:amidohydrolase family protein [Anaerolineae bacterium]
MKLSRTARDLYDAISRFTIVDAHEHLPAEAEYLSHRYAGPNMFAGGYVWHDLESAGMSSAFKETLRQGGERPVETWWPQIRPYWQHVQHTSYARALRITARDLFGVGAIDDRTIHVLAERVAADNTPGLYRRVLQERCGIRLSITCVEQVAFPDDPGLRGLSPAIAQWAHAPWDRARVAALAAQSGGEVRSLADAVSAIQALLRRDLARGALGFKIRVGDYRAPDPRAAEAQFRQAREATAPPSPLNALRDYLTDRCFDVAAAADAPVAVHTGYWGDFRELDPKYMLGIAARRRDVRYDVFHLGMPMIRDAILIGKSYPNVTLNLTWCPVISQVQTRRALDEILDMVPLNKVSAFGGDYRVAVHKVWGHLVMARECVAAALGDRIDGESLDREEALRIAHMWFYDNPLRIYRLEGQ